MSRLQHKVCIITGAAAGIGLAAARRFVQEGAKVLLTDIDASGGQRAAQELGACAAFLRHDAASADDWTAVYAEAKRLWGRVDVVVNNAGIAPLGTIETLTPQDWQKTLDVNLTGVMIGTQMAIAQMKDSGGGSIVNVASIEGIVGEQIVPAYNASKGGVRIFSKSAAIHCARSGYGIRVNCVCPGFSETAMVSGSIASMPPDFAQQFQATLLQKIPMGRLGKAEEIANAILFVASDEASFMTGADLVVDGGHTA
jgi:NAD(P)-dependent dehydrogenase (short-subunit alcohol dehydrogenase family)